MPFKSKSQQRLFYALKAKGEQGTWDGDEWAKETNFKTLPEKKTEKKASDRYLSVYTKMASLGFGKLASGSDLHPTSLSSKPAIEIKGDNLVDLKSMDKKIMNALERPKKESIFSLNKALRRVGEESTALSRGDLQEAAKIDLNKGTSSVWNNKEVSRLE